MCPHYTVQEYSILDTFLYTTVIPSLGRQWPGSARQASCGAGILVAEWWINNNITLLLPQVLLDAHAPDITCLVGCSTQVLFLVTLQPQPGTIQILHLVQVMPGAAPFSALLYSCSLHCTGLNYTALHSRLY